MRNQPEKRWSLYARSNRREELRGIGSRNSTGSIFDQKLGIRREKDQDCTVY